MALIAVTGGIGAGKTTLMHQFRDFGESTADADDIAHSLYEPGEVAYAKIVERWGNGILDEKGCIVRSEVAKIVFTQRDELSWLNELIHPLVRGRIEEMARGKCLFCAIPLLFESGWQDSCDKVVAVWCPPDVQYNRLRQRGWDDNEIKRRLASQISMDEKMARADYAIMTNCSWECLAEQCRKLLEMINNNKI